MLSISVASLANNRKKHTIAISTLAATWTPKMPEKTRRFVDTNNEEKSKRNATKEALFQASHARYRECVACLLRVESKRSRSVPWPIDANLERQEILGVMEEETQAIHFQKPLLHIAEDLQAHSLSLFTNRAKSPETRAWSMSMSFLELA